MKRSVWLITSNRRTCGGGWVDAADTDRVKSAGLPVNSSEIEYVVEHLEFALIRNLDQFMWLDEAQILLSSFDERQAHVINGYALDNRSF
ncbi:MAG: hypothetical protein ACJ74Y_02570 [Bryobacteraceae bacterium]